MTIESVLRELEEVYVSVWAARSEHQFPPASVSAIEAFEHELGRRLPDDLRDYFRTNITAHPIRGNACCPFEHEQLHNAVSNWRSMKRHYDAGTFEDGRVADREDGGNWSDGKLRRVWWHPSWVPIAIDWCGNMTCIDLAPGPSGVDGQVILMEVQDAQGPFSTELASLEALLGDTLRCLRNLHFDFVDDHLTLRNGPGLRVAGMTPA